MRNVSHNKKWNKVTKEVHVYPPPLPLIKSNNDGKLDRYFFKIKLFWDPTSEMLDLYEFTMALFDNGYPEEFLLIVCNLNMTLMASGTPKAGANIQYLGTFVQGEALHQKYLYFIILGLGMYFTPVNEISNQNYAVRNGMKKLCGFKVGHYVARLIVLNEYLIVFPGSKISEKFVW